MSLLKYLAAGTFCMCLLTMQAGAKPDAGGKEYLQDARKLERDNKYAEALEKIFLYEEAGGKITPDVQALRVRLLYAQGNLRVAQEEMEVYQHLGGRRKKGLNREMEELTLKISQKLRDYEEFLDNGARFSAAGQYEAAAKSFSAALDLDSFHGSDFYDRGFARAMLSRFQDAVYDFSQAMRKNFASPRAYYLRGFSYFSLRDTASALPDFNRALGLDSTQQEAWLFRGILQLEAKRYPAALRDLNKALALNPRDEMAYFYRAYLHHQRDELSQSLADYNKVASIDENYENVYFNRGSVRHDIGDYKGAVEDYSRHIVHCPKDDLAYNRRGAALAMLALLEGEGSHRNAIRDYDKAIQLNPQEARYYRNRAFSYKELNDFQHSIRDYRKALSLDSSASDDYVNLGLTLSLSGRRNEALKVFNQAVKRFPLDGKAWYFLGLTKKELGHHPEGNADIRTARKLGWEQGVIQPY